MPFGVKPKCTVCKILSSPMWHKNKEDEVICNSCFINPSSSTTTVTNDANTTKNKKSVSFNLRRSTRAKSVRSKQAASRSSTKGKSRRNIFKKVCVKAPTSVSSTVTAESLFYKGTYYQVGDIVNCVDFKNRVYYAQIRGLLQDQYSEKSAVITWLLPTTNSPKDRFDPATYIIGPEEDVPRKLECFEFVCHAPSEYFKAKTSPYPVIPVKPENGFIWTRMGPRIIPLPTREEVFGTK